MKAENPIGSRNMLVVFRNWQWELGRPLSRESVANILIACVSMDQWMLMSLLKSFAQS